MKRTGVIMLFFLVPGCTGLDKHAADTFYPLNNPNTPNVQSDTARRIRGETVSTAPILPEEGDVWPGQPDPVPSLQDVSRSSTHFLDKWNRSRPKLDADLKQQLSDGQGMSEGEDTDKRYGSGKGVMPIGTALPSHVHDNAPPYLQPVSRGVVTIPNGDGTVTLIAPDGSVKVVQKSKAAFFKKLRTFHKKTMPDDAIAPAGKTSAHHKKTVPDDAIAPVRETPVHHKKTTLDNAITPARKTSAHHKKTMSDDASASVRETPVHHKKTALDNTITPARKISAHHKKTAPDDATAPVRETPVHHKKTALDNAIAPARKTSAKKKVREKQHLHLENHGSNHKPSGKKRHHKHYDSDDIEW